MRPPLPSFWWPFSRWIRIIWFWSFTCSGRDLLGWLAQVFYRSDALPVTQPTVSEHWRELKALTSSQGKLSTGIILSQSTHWQFLHDIILIIMLARMYVVKIFNGNIGRAATPQRWLRHLLGEDGVSSQAAMWTHFPQVRLDLSCGIAIASVQRVDYTKCVFSLGLASIT